MSRPTTTYLPLLVALTTIFAYGCSSDEGTAVNTGTGGDGDTVAAIESSAEACQDGTDNDGDTYIDCEDFDC